VGSGDRVVGYVRVSTDDQGANGAGLEAQRQAVRSECERRGWELLRFEEDVLSGKTLRRPGLEAALAACRSGEAAGIVVAKLDRLSRSIVDFARLLEEARKKGFNIAALDLGLDLSTPQGELVANVIASVAQWERRMVGQRTREALAVKRSQGVRLGRPRVLDESIARRIRRERGRGRSYAAIADGLNADQVPTAQAGRRWYPSTIHAVAGRPTETRPTAE
jgi:DNA invertase Pin-like site-specific DNA recombinase